MSKDTNKIVIVVLIIIVGILTGYIVGYQVGRSQSLIDIGDALNDVYEAKRQLMIEELNLTEQWASDWAEQVIVE